MSNRSRNVLAGLAVLLVLFALYLLASGSPWLLFESSVFPGFPLGTLIAWCGIVALPMAIFLSFNSVLTRGHRYAQAARMLILVTIALCAGWGLVGYFLAGNWAYNFSNQSESFQGSVIAGEFFMKYTLCVLGLNLLSLAGITVSGSMRER